MTLGTSQGPDRLGDHLWATKPIMWLGPDSEDSLRAFEFDPDRGGHGDAPSRNQIRTTAG